MSEWSQSVRVAWAAYIVQSLAAEKLLTGRDRVHALVVALASLANHEGMSGDEVVGMVADACDAARVLK